MSPGVYRDADQNQVYYDEKNLGSQTLPASNAKNSIDQKIYNKRYTYNES